LAAAEIMKLKDIIVVQTKVDLVKYEDCIKNHSQIKKFLEGTLSEKSPVIPISCTPLHQYNVDVLLQYLCESIPVPKRDFNAPPILQVVRSFDVNKPGVDFESMKGGVAGGTLKQGVIRVGQFIEIRPGIIKKSPQGELQCYPIISQVRSLFSENTPLKFAVPGGLIAIGTTLDPTLTKADRLVGQIIGAVGKLPDVFLEIEVEFFLMKRLIGAKSQDELMKVTALEKGEILMLNVGSTSTTAKVDNVIKKKAKLILTKPCCVQIGEMISLSRSFDHSFRLIGCANIKEGIPLKLNSLIPSIFNE